VGEEMRHALSRIIARDELNDPDLVHLAVTITAVDMSPDLRNAIAFYVPFGVAVDQTVDTTVLTKALNRAAPFFRGQLSKEVDLRMSPTLRFRVDESFQQANRIEALLHDPLVARDLTPHEPEDGADGAVVTPEDEAEDGQA
jgi:ribosome-binding factor A